MADLEQRLERIETRLAASSDEMKAHQLNDSLEFGKAAERDERMADGIAGIQETVAEIKTALAPLTDAYNGVLFSRKFFMGMVSLILAIAAVGGAIYSFISWLRHG